MNSLEVILVLVNILNTQLQFSSNLIENVIFSIKTNVVTLLNSYLIRIVCVRTVNLPT